MDFLKSLFSRTPPSVPNPGPKVLVVEDEADLRNCIKEYLQQTGLEVEATDDGLTAEILLEQNYYDVVVTDIRLTRLDGRSVAEAARRSKYRPEILVITAYPIWKIYRDIQGLGVSDVLLKPLDLQDLANRVHTLAASKPLPKSV